MNDLLCLEKPFSRFQLNISSQHYGLSIVRWTLKSFVLGIDKHGAEFHKP